MKNRFEKIEKEVKKMCNLKGKMIAREKMKRLVQGQKRKILNYSQI